MTSSATLPPLASASASMSGRPSSTVFFGIAILGGDHSACVRNARTTTHARPTEPNLRATPNARTVRTWCTEIYIVVHAVEKFSWNLEYRTSR
ncbi:unnamed protein product [Acanthoscelides obtectus]|uniref:Uncharacterized protein n=1 Tax=Acanthoscelides obtectus TaxID=200917 RepID=A0A9P0KGN8_ACAOB|nr:unnamed protein product [Acanthoscelides obtectus]CAK1624767.1 hypothetical protein AOBTE_LOCUS2750 [Acanthoscelides obtectus]